MSNDYKAIPTNKLEKIHYMQIKIIEERRKKGLIRGAQITLRPGNKFMQAIQLGKFLGTIFSGIPPETHTPEELTGMRVYAMVLNKLPLPKVIGLEHETAQEIQRRREATRKRLDAGNIEQIAKEETKCV